MISNAPLLPNAFKMIPKYYVHTMYYIVLHMYYILFVTNLYSRLYFMYSSISSLSNGPTV